MASYTRSTTIDSAPAGDTVKQAVLDLDTDLTGIVAAYNAHDPATTAVHGMGAATICGTSMTQTLTLKTISGGTFTGTIAASGATISSPTITNATIQSSTINGLTHTAATTGFTIAGGTASKTLTVSETMTLGGYASAAEELAAASATKASNPSVSREMVINLKLVVHAEANELDIFTRSAGALPDATNPIKVMIPDGNGYTQRTRAAEYLSGLSRFVMADAANYWSKGSLDAEIKTAYVYAIWDGTGIVWALGGYSGFTRVPASTTATDDDFFLLEASSTYTKAVTDYCVCVGKIRYQYDTADTPDHTIQATVLDAPQIMWNPKSDYGYQKNLATTNTSGGNIAEYSAVSVVVKQSGKYRATFGVLGYDSSATMGIDSAIKTGSSTFSSAVQKSFGRSFSLTTNFGMATSTMETYLNAGDTIHGAAAAAAASGDRVIYGDDTLIGCTNLAFHRID